MNIQSLARFARYLLLRALGIYVTIVIGVFSTVVIMNQSGFIDQAVIKEARAQAQMYIYNNPAQYATMLTTERNQILAELTEAVAAEAGVELPYWPRQLRWTINMLTFHWGDVKGVQYTDKGPYLTFAVADDGPVSLRYRASAIVAQHFPNTLLLIGAAYALIFSLGIPLALHLARHYNSWLDRLVTGLAPLSSIPSWAYGILLVSVFVLQLHWLPFGGKYDVIPPANTAEALPMVIRHMVLPVLAIVLSMLFQIVYTWRTYFILYAEEDYVDMAVAKGLPARLLNIRYILRPTLPYILTSFAFTLTGFWQMTTALEYFFNWPGIGWMYILALLRDDLLVALGVVVIFAYVLGALVLILDLLYLLLDPRIRFNIIASTAARPGQVIQRSKANRRAPFRLNIQLPRFSLRDTWKSLHDWYTWSARPVIIELRRYPTALFSLTMIAVLVATSIYALVAYPYQQLDQLWNPELSQYRTRPMLARPLWFNWFLAQNLPETVTFDTRQSPELKQVKPGAETERTIITYEFTSSDGGFPQDAYLYIHTQNQQKRPFMTVTWLTPDGREFKLKNASVQNGETYDLAVNIPRRYLDKRYRNLALTVSESGEYPLKALFDDPADPGITPLAGRYQLKLEIITFEPGTTVDVEYFQLGQVYGWAGTDHLRRDLGVGLLWGLPVALSIGMLGALTTSLFAMLIAAGSAWYGGWVDALAQRLTEFNMMLPILAVGVLLATYFHISIWMILAITILLNAFGGTTRTYRAAFLQVKEAPYMEAARAYGASDTRIIIHYLIPRIFPLMIPQVVMLIPGYVFLEATLAIFKVSTPYTPTWGRIIYDAVTNGAMHGNYFWLIEPIALLLLTSLAFAMLGFTLDRILNPRLRTA